MGTSTGIITWVGLTVMGLTEILHHSVWLFNLIKFIGAAYLLYLAWQAFFLAEGKMNLSKVHNETSWKIFASVKDRFLMHLGFRKILNKLTGLIFLSLAIKIAISHDNF